MNQQIEAIAHSESQFHEMFSKKILLDVRDKFFLVQILRTFFGFVPLALFVLFSSHTSYWFLLAYLPLYIFLLGPQLLMVHNICHRNPWTKTARNPMALVVSFINLFFGLPPTLYFHHHIKMHHREGNSPVDLSSTERFQRDSFLAWFSYFVRFVLFIPIELPLYFARQKRWDYALKSLGGFIFFYCLIGTAFWFNAKGAIIVFIIPTAISWFGMMAGNWTQHAFLDGKEPENSYKNSITVIDSVYNRRCFNDGYHIGHHLFPGMHWTEMPNEFEKNQQKYIENGAVVFKTLDYQAIWFLLMLKRYKTLAKYYVPIDGKKREIEDIAQLLRQKMQPV